jgi:hypothetical protein
MVRFNHRQLLRIPKQIDVPEIKQSEIVERELKTGDTHAGT